MEKSIKIQQTLFFFFLNKNIPENEKIINISYLILVLIKRGY